MSNILSLQNISSSIQTIPTNIFSLDNQVYQLQFNAIPANQISILPFGSTLSPQIIYSSFSLKIFIEKVKVDSFNKRVFLYGFDPQKQIGVYGISSYINNQFQPLQINSVKNLEKVEDILFVDESNFLVLGTNKENKVWIQHPNYLPVFEIKELNGKISSIRDSVIKNDQLDIYIEVLENAVKSVRVYRYSIGDILSAFI